MPNSAESPRLCIPSATTLLFLLTLTTVASLSSSLNFQISQSKRLMFVRSIRIKTLKMINPGFFNNLFKGSSSSTSASSTSPLSASLSSFVDVAPSWEEIDSTLRSAETTEEREIFELQQNSRGPANAMADLRLFDSPEGFSPEVTLYRDTAAWCPYCEKVWLQLEEKRIPYRVEKAPLRCYGEKPKSFLRVQPNGMLPVANIKGIVVSESNEIMQVLEDQFPDYNPLLPAAGDPSSDRVPSLLRLERKAFSVWFGWLTSSRASYAVEMDSVLKEIDRELAISSSSSSSSGPYFLGERFTLVDIMFTPFLERMAASLPYFKGFQSRTESYPNLLKWYEAMDERESYRGIKSDYYTHCHDLPPQIGSCFSTPDAKSFASAIDGGSWWVDEDGKLLVTEGMDLEPMIPSDEGLARREVVRRCISNKVNLVSFACRGAGERGSPRVSAPLADPNAVSALELGPAVDSALRLVLTGLLNSPKSAKELLDTSPFTPVSSEVKQSLKYLRDRTGVPRDMTVHAARQFRAHINWICSAI